MSIVGRLIRRRTLLLEAVLLTLIALQRNRLKVFFGDLRMLLKMLAEIAEREFFGHFLPRKTVALLMILALVVHIRIGSHRLLVESLHRIVVVLVHDWGIRELFAMLDILECRLLR